MKRIPVLALVAVLGLAIGASAAPPATEKAAAKPAEKAGDKAPEKKGGWSADTWSRLSFRSIGPALTSGRIVDIAVDPTDKKRWFLAVGSGGVWRTLNAGVTWEPVFDGEGSYQPDDTSTDQESPSVGETG